MSLQPSDLGGLFSAGRIVVTGANGAGKTVFSDVLAAVRNLPLYRNDALTLTQEWRCRDPAEIAKRREAIAATDKWIFEGGPSIIGPSGIGDRAELIVWLDVPRAVRCYRITKRTLQYLGKTRPDLPDGNAERLDHRFATFIAKAWKNHDRAAAAVRSGIAGRPHLHLKGRKDVQFAIEALRRRDAAGEGAERLD